MMTSIGNIIICFMIGSIFPFRTTSTPTEIAQLVGRNVSLNCPKRSSDNIIWRFNKTTLLYNKEFKGVFRDRSDFKNDSVTGKEFLQISYIKTEDAGLYDCLDASNPDTPLQSTQLTVLDSEPTCNSKSKDNEFVGPNTCPLSQDYKHFSCAVSYHGTKAPRLQWEDVNGNQIHKECCEEKINKTTKWINCTLTLKAKPRYDKSDFRCKAVTSREQYNCSTGAIKVFYFTREEHALKPTHKAIGSEISCPAGNSSLNLSFIWTREENNKEEVVGTNRSYVIDKEGLYHCNVSYSIKDASCSAVVSVVHASQHTENCTTAFIITTSILGAIIIGLVCYIIQSRLKAGSVDKKQPINSESNGHLPHTSGEDDITTPPAKETPLIA